MTGAQAAGNLATQALLRTGDLHPKLLVGASDDPAEEEADRIADQVMHETTAGQAVEMTGDEPLVHRQCAACAAGGTTCRSCAQDDEVRRKASQDGRSRDGGAMIGRAAVVTEGGHPLSRRERAFYEPRLGRDLGRVRLHTDNAAAASARALRARAYAYGPHIVFGPGQYADNGAGARLLAHELVHVIQHGHAPVRPGEHPVPPHAGATADAPDVSRQVESDLDAGVPAAPPSDAGAVSGTDPPGSYRYSRQASCVAARGGCPESRAAGHAVPEELARYNSECRPMSRYAGPDIAPATEECRQFRSGERVDPALVTQFRALVTEYRAMLENGGMTVGEVYRIDSAVRRGYAALLRVGAPLPGEPAELPPLELSIADPAALLGSADPSVAMSGLPATPIVRAPPRPVPSLRLMPPVAPTLGGAGVGGGEAAAVGGELAAGEVIAIGAALVVLAAITMAVALTVLDVVKWYVANPRLPVLDPTVPAHINEANTIIRQTLDGAATRWRSPAPAPAPAPVAEERRRRPVRGSCFESLPFLALDIHRRTISNLDRNADDLIDLRYRGGSNTAAKRLFLRRYGYFFHRLVGRVTKNATLLVCSADNTTLAIMPGDKHLGDVPPLHAEQRAAPPLRAVLAAIPPRARVRSTLYNVCQSMACRTICEPMLWGIQRRYLPGGVVLNSPTGFPPRRLLQPLARAALERRLRSRFP